MLDAIKRWISGGGAPAPDWSSVSEWTQRQGLGFKRARDSEGFVIDGKFDDRPWRLEWGPPQRSYIAGHELRIRMELQLSSNLQMLLMSRPLVEALERETFERYTQSNQTLIDVSTPEETRWVAMFPKVSIDLPKIIKQSFTAASNDTASAMAWVDPAFGQQLVHASLNLLREQPPFVLMTLRGRLYLRLQLDEPDPVMIEQALTLFRVAVASTLRVGAGARREPKEGEKDSGEFPSTASTAWATDLTPEDPTQRGPRR
jgi:hypothetical protein